MMETSQLIRTCGMAGAGLLVILMLILTGCSQPENPAPMVSQNGTSIVPGVAEQINLTNNESITAPVITIPKHPARLPSQEITPVPAAIGIFTHYSGPDYSLDYPSSWTANTTRIPLYEYNHFNAGCSVTRAWEQDQELKAYSSTNGRTLFFSSVVQTQKEIWPRDITGQLNYADIINSYLGDPQHCANTPMGTFSLSAITDAPLNGVSYKGVKVDFGKINATGFTEGTGTSYVVTGKNRRGVFTFYSTMPDRGSQEDLSQYMFNSLRLENGF